MNANLNYVTATGIDVWNGDLEHVIGVILDFTKPDIEDQIARYQSSSLARRCHGC